MYSHAFKIDHVVAHLVELAMHATQYSRDRNGIAWS